MFYTESENVELKEIYTPDLKKEVVAFANSEGGTIFIGINDNGEFVGIENSDFAMQQISNTIRDSICPDVTMFTNLTYISENNKTAIKLTVTQGTRRPYYIQDKGLKPSGVYVRQGTTAAPASEDAIRQMIKQTDGDSFESNRSLLQDLTFKTLEEEMSMRQLNFGVVQQKTIGILSPDSIYTNLGLLVSDQCLHSTKLAVFQGTDKLVFKDRKEFTGSIFKQLNDAYQAIDFYNSTRADFNHLLRIDERDYPIDAVREALLNALVHRDYGFSGSTFINLYADRIEFVSLGGLITGLSIDAVMLGASQPRNEKLAALFYRMKLIEAYGTGIGKILSSYSVSGKMPTFESVDGAFRVVLPNLHFGDSTIMRNYVAINDSAKKVIEFIRSNSVATRQDVQSVLNVGTSRAIAILKGMITQGLIKKQGSGKNTVYILK